MAPPGLLVCGGVAVSDAANEVDEVDGAVDWAQPAVSVTSAEATAPDRPVKTRRRPWAAQRDLFMRTPLRRHRRRSPWPGRIGPRLVTRLLLGGCVRACCG